MVLADGLEPPSRRASIYRSTIKNYTSKLYKFNFRLLSLRGIHFLENSKLTISISCTNRVVCVIYSGAATRNRTLISAVQRECNRPLYYSGVTWFPIVDSNHKPTGSEPVILPVKLIGNILDGKAGLEPTCRGSKPLILPLDDFPICFLCVFSFYILHYARSN